MHITTIVHVVLVHYKANSKCPVAVVTGCGQVKLAATIDYMYFIGFV